MTTSILHVQEKEGGGGVVRPDLPSLPLLHLLFLLLWSQLSFPQSLAFSGGRETAP